MTGDVFGALSDPTRRHVFQTLASDGPMTATALASDMHISRQAVSKHLGILSDAGMAASTRVGRETRFEANVEPLSAVEQWIQDVEGQWDRRLASLARTLSSQRDLTS